MKSLFRNSKSISGDVSCPPRHGFGLGVFAVICKERSQHGHAHKRQYYSDGQLDGGVESTSVAVEVDAHSATALHLSTTGSEWQRVGPDDCAEKRKHGLGIPNGRDLSKRDHCDIF